MQFKVGDLVRILDRDDVVGTVIEIDEQIIVDVEKDFELFYCDPLNVGLVTDLYDKGVRLPIFMDKVERDWKTGVG